MAPSGHEASSGSPGPLCIVVVCPNQLARSCTVAGLSEVDGLLAEECADLGDVADRRPPDLVLFQDQEGKSDVDWLAAQLHCATQVWSGAMLMVLTSDIEHGIGVCLDAGAHACLPSNASLDHIVAAARLVRQDLTVYPDQILADWASMERRISTVRTARNRASTSHLLTDLTGRQTDVVRLLATGMSNKAIAHRLNIAESTVKVHVRAIIKHIGLQNRTQVAAHFMAVNGSRETG